MAKPKHIDLTEDGVITQEALLAYAEGRLSDAERVQVDKLLRDDPFAQDALEGLRKSASHTQINTAISSINTQLREKTGIRERKKKGIDIHWANYAYAAVILGVLMGVGFVMVHVLSSERREETMNKPVPKAQESVPVMEEKKKEEPKADTTMSVAAAEKKDSIKSKSEPVTASGTATGTPAMADASREKKPITQTVNDKSSSAPVSNQEKSKGEINGETAAQLGVARTYFGSGDYINAEKKYNEILASQPDNADALYFGGICAFYNSSKGLGEANFDKLAKTGMYPEGAKWYKANILIKKGRKEEAKPLLRDLINSNSSFKDRAVKQYEDLYK